MTLLIENYSRMQTLVFKGSKLADLTEKLEEYDTQLQAISRFSQVALKNHAIYKSRSIQPSFLRTGHRRNGEKCGDDCAVPRATCHSQIQLGNRSFHNMFQVSKQQTLFEFVLDMNMRPVLKCYPYLCLCRCEGRKEEAGSQEQPRGCSEG